MSALPLTILPPSFSSFPDQEVGSSTLTLRSRNIHDSKHDKKSNRGSKYLRRKYNGVGGGEYSSTEDFEQRNCVSKGVVNESSRLYYSDRKGDSYNVQYGRSDSRSTLRYSLVDRGRNVLGASRSWTASYWVGKGVEVQQGARKSMLRLADSSVRSLLLAPPTRRVLQINDTHKYREIHGFLHLSLSHRQSVEKELYRSITASKYDSSDTELHNAAGQVSEDGGSADELTLTSYQETLKHLEQQLERDPTSSDNWFRLLSHTLSAIPMASKNVAIARSEVTISVLTRAFITDPRNKMSVALRLRYMKAGEEIWNEGKTKTEWEEALKLGSVTMWMEWLEWQVKQAIDGIRGVVKDSLRVLGLLSQNRQNELAKIRVFWRLALIFQNAGFSERAMAMFQAQAELIFNIPKALYGLPHETQLDQLEQFWDSEAPRVGEVGSQGWAAWALSGGGEADPVSSKPSMKDIHELDPYRQWAAQETEMDRSHRLPSHSFGGSIDPYSTVLFSDIRALLIRLESASAKDAFRRAWLSFLGLHIPGFPATLSGTREINWDDRWNQGHLTRLTFLDALFPTEAVRTGLATEAHAGVIVGREKHYASSLGPVKSWSHGTFGPLDQFHIHIEPAVGQSRAVLWQKEDIRDLDVELVRRVFTQLRLGGDDAEWDLLTLAFESAFQVKSALKLSRSFLSQNESLNRWAAHAQLEAMDGRLDEARKIYLAVLLAPHATSQGTITLWWNWAEMEWLSGNSTQALQVAMRAARAEGQGSIAILRCKNNLYHLIKEESHWKNKEGWIKLCALLELLITVDASPALDVFDHHLHEDLQDAHRESLQVSCVLMLYQFSSVLKNPMPPSVLRQRVEKAFHEYPSNSVLLALFLEGEKGRGVWGRVRALLGHSTGRAKDVTRCVEEVWIIGWERGRWRGEAERTRGGLTDAIENERTRGSHIIWRIYIEFEIRAGDLQRAKKLLFRAIRECPLVKELYLLAYGPLRSVFSAVELRRIADTMAERGLRIWKDLDETLQGWQGDMLDGSDSESEDDEIVHNAQEMRRLMPY